MGVPLSGVPGYLVDAPLGDGGSGGLWRGREAVSLDPVAMKRLEFEDITEYIHARSAAARLAALDHPNLIRLREVVPSGAAAVVVLDLAAGGSLADRLDVRFRLTPGEVINVVAPIADALAYLHEAGVVHGDVSPANVVFSEDGTPMLAGLAGSRLKGAGAPLHRAVGYLDPGVAAGFLPIPESDLFMLAGVAVHALTGAPLWRAHTVEHALLAALTANLEDLGTRLEAASVPDMLTAVLRSALSPDPRGRGNAADFAVGLRACDERVNEPVGAPVISNLVQRAHSTQPTGVVPAIAARTTPARRSRPGHRCRRTPWDRFSSRAIVALACLGAALLGAGVASGASGRGGEHPAGTGLIALPVGTTAAAALGGAVESVNTAIASADSGSPVAPESATGAGVVLTAAQASTVLVQLDAIREQAFARRAPLLLTGVYEPGVLLDEDTASLERVVPAGCGLEGVHTAYTNVQLAANSAAEVDVTAQATLAPSVLFCNGVAKARAPGSGPSPLHIALVRSGEHYLIHTVSS